MGTRTWTNSVGSSKEEGRGDEGRAVFAGEVFGLAAAGLDFVFTATFFFAVDFDAAFFVDLFAVIRLTSLH